MQNPKTLSELFQAEPTSWGLRGDPYLWRELKTRMEDQAYPKTEADFKHLLEQAYQQLTGQPLAEPGPVLIERFSHGGLSSGRVDPHFWLETGFPLLLARYRETNRSENAG